MSGTLGARLRASLAVGAALATVLVLGSGARGVQAAEVAGPATVTVSQTTFANLGDGSQVVTVSGSGFDPLANISTRPPIPAGNPTGVYVIFGRFADVWQPSSGAAASTRKVIDQKWALPQSSIDLVAPNPAYVPLQEDGTFSTTLTISKGDPTFTGNYAIVTYAAGGAAANAAQETFTPISFVDIVASKTTFTDIGDGSEVVTVSGSGFDPLANISTRPPIPAGNPTGVYVIFGRFADVWQPSSGAAASTRKVIDQKWALPQSSIDLVAPNPAYVPLQEDGTFSTTLTISKGDPTFTGNYAIVTYAAGGAAANAAQETFTPITFVDTPVEPEPQPQPPAATVLELVAPARVLDTRPGASTVDGESAGTGIVAPGTPVKVKVTDRAGVPADATAVSLNVTATGAEGTGYVTIWPCGEPQPGTSSLNLAAGATVANVVVAGIGEDGSVCLAASETSTHLIADVAGYSTAASGLGAVAPTRLLDTRAENVVTSQAVQKAGVVRTVQVGGAADVPADAQAALLNVTAADATGTGYVTVWACDGTPPTTSNLNTVPGRAVAAGVVASLSADGTVCLVAGQADAEIIVDVVGYVPAGAAYQQLTPARLLDTRPGASTVDGEGLGAGIVATTTSVQVAGRGAVAADASAAILSVTADGATADGYVTVWTCGEPQPATSNLNVSAGQPTANAVIVALGADGTVCLAVGDTTANLIVDVLATM